MTVDGESITLSEGDNFTTPIGSMRSFSNKSEQETVLYVTRKGDKPLPPAFESNKV
jgi:quercetin dioxygenase-like cupin family protein